MTRRFEGYRAEAYQDAGGVWTIGYGHTGSDVHGGLVWTREQAEAALMRDIAGSVAWVNRVVSQRLEQHQFDALVDFCFNCGAGSLERSTLLRKVNAGEMEEAAAQFELWVHDAAGSTLPGLVMRRRAEARMFLGEPWSAEEAA
ncbi:MAG: lysozyme [Acidobacteriaceae bacterium]